VAWKEDFKNLQLFAVVCRADEGLPYLHIKWRWPTIFSPKDQLHRNNGTSGFWSHAIS